MIPDKESLYWVDHIDQSADWWQVFVEKTDVPNNRKTYIAMAVCKRSTSV